MRQWGWFGATLWLVASCRADRGVALVDHTDAPLLSSEIALDAPTTGIADGTQVARDVSFDGTHWYAIWSDLRTGSSELRGSRLDASGAALDGPGTVLATATSSTAFSAAVAFDGKNHVVVFRDGANVSLRPVGTDGVAGATVVLGTGATPAIAANGDGAVIAWTSGANVMLRTRTSAGSLGSAALLGAGSFPKLAWDGASYVVGWQFGGRLQGAHLDATGVAVETTPIDLFTTRLRVQRAECAVRAHGPTRHRRFRRLPAGTFGRRRVASRTLRRARHAPGQKARSNSSFLRLNSSSVSRPDS